MQNADDLGFNVGDTIEGIEKQATGSFIERERHGVDGEVAAAQVLVNGGGGDDGGLAGFLELLGTGHADFGAGVTGERDEDSASVFVDGGDAGAGLFEIFLQLEGIALDGEIEIADGKAADDVADGAAGEVKIQARGAGYVLHQVGTLHLIRGQPEFHRVNVISHSLSSGRQAGVPAAGAALQPRPGPTGRTTFHRISTALYRQTVCRSAIQMQVAYYKVLRPNAKLAAS